MVINIFQMVLQQTFRNCLDSVYFRLFDDLIFFRYMISSDKANHENIAFAVITISIMTLCDCVLILLKIVKCFKET